MMPSSKEDEAKIRTTIPSSSSSSSSFSYSLLGLVLVLVLVLYCDVEASNALGLAPLRPRPSRSRHGDSPLSRTSQEEGSTDRAIVPPQLPQTLQQQPPQPQPPQPQPQPSPWAQPPSAPPQPTPSSSPPRPTPTPTPPSSNTSSSSSSNCSEIGGLTEGPYWVEENLQASDVREDLPFGLRLDLIFKVDNISSSSSWGPENNNNGSCEAVENVRIDVWQARYDGIYSDVEEDNTQGETWLRGYQFTNSSGYACFTTIYPGWYSGRTPHIHVRVRTYDSDNTTTLYEDTSQLFFNDTINEEVFNNVFPYNTRSSKRDTYNNGDSLFTTSNVIPLVGNYIDGYTSSTVELNIPFSMSSSYSNAFIRRISDDDDFDQHHT